MSAEIARTTTAPDVGSTWKHRRGGRTVRVVGNRIDDVDGRRVQLVEYRYNQGVGGMGRSRSTPTQTMELTLWADLFRERVR